MNCIVTAGPTYEPLDDVRRLTNFSTGRLGTELANFLAARGHKVILLIGDMATYGGERRAQRVETFTTTADLREKLKALSAKKVDAIFHAAAVSDFAFGRIFTPRRIRQARRNQGGQKNPHPAGQVARRAGADAQNHRRTARLVSADAESRAGNLKRRARARTPSAPRNGRSPNVRPICAWRTVRLTAKVLAGWRGMAGRRIWRPRLCCLTRWTNFCSRNAQPRPSSRVLEIRAQPAGGDSRVFTPRNFSIVATRISAAASRCKRTAARRR